MELLSWAKRFHNQCICLATRFSRDSKFLYWQRLPGLFFRSAISILVIGHFSGYIYTNLRKGCKDNFVFAKKTEYLTSFESEWSENCSLHHMLTIKNIIRMWRRRQTNDDVCPNQIMLQPCPLKCGFLAKPVHHFSWKNISTKDVIYDFVSKVDLNYYPQNSIRFTDLVFIIVILPLSS